jgi:DNA topoisomerase-3
MALYDFPNQAQLGKLTITYGPCQTPRVWFVVHRHDVISTFVPQPYWNVSADMSLDTCTGGTVVRLQSVTGDLWSGPEAAAVLEGLHDTKKASVERVDVGRRTSLPKPLPLNTVALLKAASDTLGL